MRFAREERGQALIVIAAAFVVLLGAAAFAVDWGYGMTQRRIMQNAADSASLGAAKRLAQSVVEVNGQVAFSASQQEIWCEAKRLVDANRSIRPGGATTDVVLEFGNAASPTAWTTGATSATCPTSGGTAVPADTVLVRVASNESYPALIARVVGVGSFDAAASAAARLVGTPVAGSGPIWPMVRHYDPADFNTACRPSCDPTTLSPVTFWSSNATNVVYGNFKGLIDFSRNSSRRTGVAQLETGWDRTGSAQATPPTAPKPDLSGNCGGLWDTAGGEDPQNQDKQCSIPNWFGYLFGGQLSLDTRWSSQLVSGQEAPTALGSRAVCTNAPDPSPSCTDPSVGDWIETAFGNVGTNMSDDMRALVASRGHIDRFSDQVVSSGPNRGTRFGKALVVLVYLWDCAESYSSSAAAGAQWDLIVPTSGQGRGDCSQIPATGSTPTPDRVHLFTVAPFTFYEGLITLNQIQGYWGGAFGDASACVADPTRPQCRLNPLSNSVFPVAGD